MQYDHILKFSEEPIPDSLLNKDLTRNITRREFSALAVRLYEVITNTTVDTKNSNPFKDVDDLDVTKAYDLGIVSGVGNGMFLPDDVLTREQACTMLTRVYKAAFWEGWTLQDDATYSKHVLDIAGVNMFEDDGLISAYARQSVYFMVKNGIINGLGNNLFGPKPLQGKDPGYGNATMEQAFKIAVAMKEKFASK